MGLKPANLICKGSYAHRCGSVVSAIMQETEVHIPLPLQLENHSLVQRKYINNCHLLSLLHNIVKPQPIGLKFWVSGYLTWGIRAV